MPNSRQRGADRQEYDIDPEKPSALDEHVDVDAEDVLEEEVEYEEVVEEVEEEEEIEEEEVEEEEEEDQVVDEQNEEGNDNNESNIASQLLSLPPHGSEVYIGSIPHDTSESELREFCETIGEVKEVRIMKGKDSSEGKGYAFVTFKTKELASKAIDELNNTEFMGRRVKCSQSQANHRLFIGNVPRNWEDHEMKNAVKRIGPGVTNVELLKDPQNSRRNRGFAFIEYYNHACADYARRKMSDSGFKLDGNSPTVSWADPKNGNNSTLSQVKAIYVKNLPREVTQEQVKHLFERHGKVTKVVLPPAKPGHENSRYGFVHFSERACAMKALKNTEKYEIDGHILDCSLAKPQSEQKNSQGGNNQKGSVHHGFPPRLGYGLVGSPYGGLGGGYGSPPMIYGGGGNPANMAMMPMLLPDGRIGYVLQQPSMQAHLPPHGRGGRGGGAAASGAGKRGHDARGRHRYNPY